MKNPKVLLPIVILIVGLLAGKTFFAKAPAAAAPKPKVEGQVYVLPKDFLVNLTDGRFAKLDVGLILKEGYLETAIKAAGTDKEGAPKPPDGYGTLPQEAVVRDIITDDLTGAKADDLIVKSKREELKKGILLDLKKHTDVEVEDVMLTDVAVQ
ncbi:MAG: flagellar basal body-associated FliL family protein [Solirubrobacteraceae bacterium]